MNKLFYKCSNLISLPDISNWDKINIANISGIFAECSSLSKLIRMNYLINVFFISYSTYIKLKL